MARLRDELADVFRPVARDKGIELTHDRSTPACPRAIVTDSDARCSRC